MLSGMAYVSNQARAIFRLGLFCDFQECANWRLVRTSAREHVMEMPSMASSRMRPNFAARFNLNEWSLAK